MECSLIASGTCFSKEAVDVMKQKTGKTSALEAVTEIKKQTKCSTSNCIIGFLDGIDKEKESANFKIEGPTDTSLLSNFDIDDTMKQWKHKYPNFKAIEFSMVDFERFGDALSKFVPTAGCTFGCVINTDVYAGQGKHWMAIYGCPESVELFNSSGQMAADSFTKWVKKTAAAMGAKPVFTTREHQRSMTECGVYSLYYIWSRLAGVPYTWFETNQVPDIAMGRFRQKLFVGKKPWQNADGTFNERVFISRGGLSAMPGSSIEKMEQDFATFTPHEKVGAGTTPPSARRELLAIMKAIVLWYQKYATYPSIKLISKYKYDPQELIGTFAAVNFRHDMNENTLLANFGDKPRVTTVASAVIGLVSHANDLMSIPYGDPISIQWPRDSSRDAVMPSIEETESDICEQFSMIPRGLSAENVQSLMDVIMGSRYADVTPVTNPFN